jgi:hypothetical protein
VSTAQATIIDVAAPFSAPEQAAAWLGRAGENELAADLAVLNEMLHAHRVTAADPHMRPVSRDRALVARIGFGEGEQVADGRWSEARELIAGGRRQRRVSVLSPSVRLAAVLGGRERPLVAEELTLRARLDLDLGRHREAALQLLIALDAALAELDGESALAGRLEELRERRAEVEAAARTARGGALSDGERESVASALGRLEAAFRARAAARPS